MRFAESWNYMHLGIVFVLALMLLAVLQVNMKKAEYGYRKEFEWMAYLLTIGVGFWLFWTYGVQLNTAVIFLLVPIMVVICFVDWKLYIIPNRLNLLLLLGALLFVALNIGSWKMFILGGGILVVLFAVLYIFSGGNLGMGDVKMAFPLGLLLGYPLLMNFLLYAFVSAAVISLALLVTKQKKKDDKIAFGPYMIIGFLLAILI